MTDINPDITFLAGMRNLGGFALRANGTVYGGPSEPYQVLDFAPLASLQNILPNISGIRLQGFILKNMAVLNNFPQLSEVQAAGSIMYDDTEVITIPLFFGDNR